MTELRTTTGLLAGKFSLTWREFRFEYKHKKGMITVILPLFPKLGEPSVTIH